MSKLPKVIKPKPSLIAKINTYLKDSANPEFKEGESPRVRPSDLGSPCMRKIYYSYLRTEPDQKIKPEQKRIFDIGDAIHEMIRGWVKGANRLVEYRDPQTGQIPLNKYTQEPDPEFPIVVEELDIKKGKIDAIVILDEKLWIGEWKSSKSSKFEDLTDAQEDHKIQANTYVHLFEFCWNRGDYSHIEELKDFKEIAGVIFLYLNKDTSELKEFIVPKDDSSLDIIVEKISTLKHFVEKKELPPPTEHYCYFCPYSKKCEREFNPLNCEKKTEVEK